MSSGNPAPPSGPDPEPDRKPAPFRPADGPIRLDSGRRFLGFDLGTKTIGLALSDTGHHIASPYQTLARRKFSQDAAELVKIAAKENVGALVLGLPVNMDGTEGPRCQATRAFARNIAQLIPVPVALWDERLSTVAVQRMMTEEADLSRARRAELVDKLAASYILQSYLDWVRQQPS
jgi:putative Holliday junction resolvase